MVKESLGIFRAGDHRSIVKESLGIFREWVGKSFGIFGGCWNGW